MTAKGGCQSGIPFSAVAETLCFRNVSSELCEIGALGPGHCDVAGGQHCCSERKDLVGRVQEPGAERQRLKAAILNELCIDAAFTRMPNLARPATSLAVSALATSNAGAVCALSRACWTVQYSLPWWAAFVTADK